MKWALVYQRVMSSVTRNAIALYMTELLSKCMKQPEANSPLFELAAGALRLLDECDDAVAANLPLHFTLQLAAELGFGLEDEYSATAPVLDLKEGRFVAEPPIHGFYLQPPLSEVTHQLLQHENPVTLYRIRLNKLQRRELLQSYAHFFHYHVADFGQLKTLAVLQAVLD
ncbi:MAG: DNA repair protein RecO C-terminal domain-containing protein [Chitinophagaceae bacterium]|nr:DNA repair protein RecO C-terminal domain-containing protein [Chitinophagaceae bacterium]